MKEKLWIANYDKGVPENVNFMESFIPENLEQAAVEFPDKIALIFQGYKINFRNLNEMTNKFASCLIDFGIKKGDSVSVLLPNTIHCVVSYYAILRIGAIVVMNNPLYSDRELEHQFKDSDSKALITLDLLANRMIDLRPKTKIKNIIYCTLGDYLPFPKNILFPLVAKKKKLVADVKSSENIYKWKEIIDNASSNPPKVKHSLEDTAMYQYTGGTTGVSKGVVLTHSNLSKQVQQIRAWYPSFGKGMEVMLGALPFFHVFGLSTSMNFAIAMGWCNILVPKPQPEQLLEAITKFKPSFAPLVPMMYIGLLAHPDIDKADLSSLKGCFSGSAPLPLEVINEFEKKTGSVIVEGFGLTESTPVTHINPFNGIRKIGSIGLPVSDTDCMIVDLEDGVTPKDVEESGELLIKGPQVMKEYLNRPDATEETLKNGWLHTGDVAKMDKDGYFYIVDRIKDMILSGGYNVYPRDIDEILYENPKIEEACSIGIPHPTRGEAIKAFIVLKDGETATETEIIEYCGTKLAKYKLPTHIEFREELPKSAVGKILRKDLREGEKNKTSQL